MQLYIPPPDWAVFHLGAREIAEALACLEQAYDERTSFIVLLNLEPLFSTLRAEPRFQDLLRRLDRQSAAK